MKLVWRDWEVGSAEYLRGLLFHQTLVLNLPSKPVSIPHWVTCTEVEGCTQEGAETSHNLHPCLAAPVLTVLTISQPPPLYLTLAIVDMHTVITAHSGIFSGSVKPNTEWSAAVYPASENSWLTPDHLLTPSIKPVRTEYLLVAKASVCLYQNVILQ